MGLFSLVTKPLRIADALADVAEKKIIDPSLNGVVDYVTGDWDGAARRKRASR